MSDDICRGFRGEGVLSDLDILSSELLYLSVHCIAHPLILCLLATVVIPHM